MAAEIRAEKAEAEAERLNTLVREYNIGAASYRAKIERLRKVLKQIADPSYIGNYSDREVVEIYRKWATYALQEQDG